MAGSDCASDRCVYNVCGTPSPTPSPTASPSLAPTPPPTPSPTATPTPPPTPAPATGGLAELMSVANVFTEKAASGKLDVGYDLLAIALTEPPEPYVPPDPSFPTGERQQVVMCQPDSKELPDNIVFNITFNGETTATMPVDAEAGAAQETRMKAALEALRSVGTVSVNYVTNSTAACELEVKWIVTLMLLGEDRTRLSGRTSSKCWSPGVTRNE